MIEVIGNRSLLCRSFREYFENRPQLGAAYIYLRTAPTLASIIMQTIEFIDSEPECKSNLVLVSSIVSLPSDPDKKMKWSVRDLAFPGQYAIRKMVQELLFIRLCPDLKIVYLSQPSWDGGVWDEFFKRRKMGKEKPMLVEYLPHRIDCITKMDKQAVFDFVQAVCATQQNGVSLWIAPSTKQEIEFSRKCASSTQRLKYRVRKSILTFSYSILIPLIKRLPLRFIYLVAKCVVRLKGVPEMESQDAVKEMKTFSDYEVINASKY